MCICKQIREFSRRADAGTVIIICIYTHSSSSSSPSSSRATPHRRAACRTSHGHGHTLYLPAVQCGNECNRISTLNFIFDATEELPINIVDKDENARPTNRREGNGDYLCLSPALVQVLSYLWSCSQSHSHIVTAANTFSLLLRGTLCYVH